MFNANAISQGISNVNSYDDMIELLAGSRLYTFGDRFTIGNIKIGSASVQPDEAHPGWTWSPMNGQAYSVAQCQVPGSVRPVMLVSGTRAGDAGKRTLCIYVMPDDVAQQMQQALSLDQGGTSIGMKLAHTLGYTDWAILNPPGPSESNKCTSARLDLDGMKTTEEAWVNAAKLNIPDDGQHYYRDEFDHYSGTMLVDQATTLPGMILRSWKHSLNSSVMIMARSTYDADCQNTDDVIRESMRISLAKSKTDITGLLSANGALYAAITAMPVFGAKFVDVVDASKRLDNASQYIPRP